MGNYDREEKFLQYIYDSLQLCKMTDARASHINAKQGKKEKKKKEKKKRQL
jgi:hypothetical protein